MGFKGPFDPRYIYEKYERNKLMSVKELNTFASFFVSFGKKPSILAAIVFALVMTGLLAIFKIRQSLMAEELKIGQQNYERLRSKVNQSDLDGDDLDGQKR